jgi:uncharacterized protein YegL
MFMAGTYKQEISATKNLPSCLIVLLDQSGSMADQFGADKRSKAIAAALAVNRALEMLVDNCTKGEDVRDYFHVGVIGYGNNAAQDLLTGGSGPAGLLISSKLEERAATVEVETEEVDHAGNLKVDQLNKWFDPVANGGTPMDEAFNMASAKLQQWVASYPNSFPPMVLNITDGEPNQPDVAESAARALQQIKTSDGDTLLFNCHISSTGAAAVEYPTSEQGLPDDKAQWLFRISSEIPESLVSNAQAAGLTSVVPGSRGFVYNANAGKLVKFLRIGTKVVAEIFDR